MRVASLRSAARPLLGRPGAPIGCRRRTWWPIFTRRRRALALSVRAIAAEFTRRGVTTSHFTIVRWERHGIQPSERRLALLPEILQCAEQDVLVMFDLDFGLGAGLPTLRDLLQHTEARRGH